MVEDFTEERLFVGEDGDVIDKAVEGDDVIPFLTSDPNKTILAG